MYCPAESPLPGDQRYNQAELSFLHQMAAEYVNGFREEMKPCPTFCRDKTDEYYNALPDNGMKTYVKDNSGDPRNPINGRLAGLFFSTNSVIQKTGTPNPESIYGTKRLSLSADQLVKWAPNLYFSDFYCLSRDSKAHYVQIVMTKPGSEADLFCFHNLTRLDRRNPFFIVEGYLGSDPNYSRLQPVRCRVTTSVWVEIFITENIKLPCINEHLFSHVRMIGKRPDRSIGLKKNIWCPFCNISIRNWSYSTHYNQPIAPYDLWLPWLRIPKSSAAVGCQRYWQIRPIGIPYL